MKTMQDQYVESMPLVRGGYYAEAAQIIEESKGTAYKEKDRVLYYLDSGMLLHWAGEYERSNIMLSEAENAIEELYTASVSKGIASAFLNDNALDYSGEDYEDVYLNVFKALNYIALGNNESAHVEIRRVQLKLNLLDDKYKKFVEEYNNSEDAKGELTVQENRFHNSALARYMSLLLYRAEGSLDDARIDREAIEEAWETQTHLYDFEKAPLPSIEESNEGTARVNIISFSGLSPVKLADTLYVTSALGMVFIATEGMDDAYVENLTGFTVIPMPGIPEGIHFKMQFARMESRGSIADRVVVKFDGQEVAEIPMLENMEKTAQEIFLLRQPLVVGRTVIRATVKNVSKELGKSALNTALNDQGAAGTILGLLAGVAADVAVDATENADLRISHFFPSSAKAVELEVEQGSYQVSVEYWDGANLLGITDHGVQQFDSGGLNIVESYMLN